MSKVHLLNVAFDYNPSSFSTPFQLIVNFKCLEALLNGLEFKLIYASSTQTCESGRILDHIVFDALQKGEHKFGFFADSLKTISKHAEIFITASYRKQEFLRICYSVKNEYEDAKMRERPPTEPQLDKLIRTIETNESCVKIFSINWGSILTYAELSFIKFVK